MYHRREIALVLAMTLVFVVHAALLPLWDRPLGDGWNRYLGNAIAIAEGDWANYLRWRGPVHAVLCLLATPLMHSLVRGAQLVALLSTAALIPLTWALGRRLLGPFAALLSVGLLLAWPDLALFARMSSSYPLQAALSTLGALLAVTAERKRTWALAGLVLGVGIATDLRGIATGGAILIGASFLGKPRFIGPVVAGAVAAAVGAGLLALLPVKLYGLTEQVALQRDLTATFVAGCPRLGPVAPSLADMVGPCGRAVLAHNLSAVRAALPIPLVLPLLIAALGGLPSSRVDLSRRALLVLPTLTLLPALAVIVMQHRYIVPVSPFVALLLGSGLARLARTRVTQIGAIALVVALGIGWHASNHTLLTHVLSPVAADPSQPARPGQASLADAAGEAAAKIRADYAEGDAVVDCANANLRERLYPIPVKLIRPGAGKPARACTELLAKGPKKGSAWLLGRAGMGEPGEGWSVVIAPGAGGDMALLRWTDTR